MEQNIDWKEQKFQEKLSQIFEIIGTDLYFTLSNISFISSLCLFISCNSSSVGKSIADIP